MDGMGNHASGHVRFSHVKSCVWSSFNETLSEYLLDLILRLAVFH